MLNNKDNNDKFTRITGLSPLFEFQGGPIRGRLLFFGSKIFSSIFHRRGVLYFSHTVFEQGLLRWSTNINLRYEKTVIEVYLCIFHSLEIRCCVRMVRHQSSTSTTWGSNLSITQLSFQYEIFNIVSQHFCYL